MFENVDFKKLVKNFFKHLYGQLPDAILKVPNRSPFKTLWKVEIDRNALASPGTEINAF